MDNTQKIILFISHSSDLYGAERCLLDLVINLPKKIKPIVIIPSSGKLHSILKYHDVESYIFKFRGWWYRKFRIKLIYRCSLNLFSVIKLYVFFKKKNIDLVYTNTMYSPIGIILAKLLRVKHIQHCHEYLNLNNSASFDFGIFYSTKFISNNSSAIICISNSHLLDLRRFMDPKKLNIVYNGVTFNSNIDIQKQVDLDLPLKILVVGSISINKNQFLALKAISILVKKGINIQLSFIGNSLDPNYEVELKMFIQKEDLFDNVTFLGFKKNVEEFLQLNDILLVCSNNETFGRVVIEAMAMKVPVIASDLPSIAEIIKHRENGLLFPSNNCDLLVNSIETLLHDSLLRESITNNGYTTYLNNFTLNIYVNNIYNILKNELQIS